jgi:hypothetical protein
LFDSPHNPWQLCLFSRTTSSSQTKTESARTQSKGRKYKNRGTARIHKEWFCIPQVGTFWWHGHNAAHSSEGFYGSFVVRPNPAFGDVEPFGVPNQEDVLLLNDWWHRSMQDQMIGLDIPQNNRSDFR